MPYNRFKLPCLQSLETGLCQSPTIGVDQAQVDAKLYPSRNKVP